MASEKTEKKDIKNTILGTVIIIALISWWMYEPDWEKQGYENDEIFEQAEAGGFQDRPTFEAAKDAGFSTLAEWNAYNEAERLEKERKAEEERIAAELKALRARCVETERHGEVCLSSANNYKPSVSKTYTTNSGLIDKSKKGQPLTLYNLNRVRLYSTNAKYVDVDGNPLDFLEVAYDYEMAMAHRRIDDATIEKAFECKFDPVSRSKNQGKSWTSYIVTSNTALISERHWYVGYEDDYKTVTEGSAIEDGDALVLDYRGTLDFESADFYERDEEYEVGFNTANLEQEEAGKYFSYKIKIDRKTGLATYDYSTSYEPWGKGKCSAYDGDVTVLLKKLMTDKVDAFMKSAIKVEKAKRAKLEAERKKSEERAKMEIKL